MQRLIDIIGMFIAYILTAISTTLIIIVALFTNPKDAKTIAKDFKQFTKDYWR